MTNSGIQERPVVLGQSDDFWTAVREGLMEGEQVVMEAAQVSSGPFAAFRQLRGGGGGGNRTIGVGGGGGGHWKPLRSSSFNLGGNHCGD